MKRKSFWARIWAKLRNHDRAEGLLKAGDRVLAAVSGGPDSVCLAHYLQKLKSRLRLDLRLAHVHHGLRGDEADRDAQFVEHLGRKLGLPVSILQVDVPTLARREGRSLEDAARRLRYGALAREARRHGCNKVAVGHQLDDQAETVLLNLLRGRGWEGLQAMRAVRRLAEGRKGTGDVRLIRPLLCLGREEVLEYLLQNGLRFRTDRSNFSDRFARNWVRRRLLPLLRTRNPKVRDRLGGLARSLQKMGDKK